MTSTDFMPTLEFPQPRSRNHKWDWLNERRIAACDSPSKNDQTERDCVMCKLTKVTVHPPGGFPYREWRHPRSKTQFACSATPPCLEVVA